MTKLIFLCSGNTCRSPMAAGFAREIFGPGHTVASAGAETAAGSPPARHAVTAMKELGIDISGHKAVELDASTLEQFDAIILFRPSAAEDVTLPGSVSSHYLDIPDPYGGDLEEYRRTAHVIRSAVRDLYARDVLRRLTSPNPPSGSHLEGMYGRAAREFERELHVFVKASVDPQVRPKATLGELAGILHRSDEARHKHLAALADAANAPWVDFKHKDDPSVPQIEGGLRGMIEGYGLTPHGASYINGDG